MQHGLFGTYHLTRTVWTHRVPKRLVACLVGVYYSGLAGFLQLLRSNQARPVRLAIGRQMQTYA